MGMSRHFVEAVIKEKGWQPYIATQWLDFGKQKGGYIITFKGHTQHEFKCSFKVGKEILELARSRN